MKRETRKPKKKEARRNGGPFIFPIRFFFGTLQRGETRRSPCAIAGTRSPPLPVLHQPGKRAVVTPLGGGGEKTGGELVRLPVKGDARTAATPPLARIGAGAFFCITATFHRYSSFIQLDTPKR